ncbi:MAG: ankyrin repeat domain-containing protein [Burkholderiales bacterium]|nr:ankyrin repeat domain-containing protein [Burkholderiales bacterium]
MSDSHRLVFNRLTECIAQSTGVVCLLGPAGVGKSTLIARAVKTSMQEGVDIFYKDLSPFINVQEEGEAAPDDFSGAISAVREGDGLPEVDCRKVVYVMDATDNIDENSLVKLIKSIEQQNTGNNSALLILAGRDSLEQPLGAAQQALSAGLFQGSYFLDTLSEAEVGNYINHRFHVVHFSGEPIFTSSAVHAVAELSNGIPRQINTICGMALFQADKEHSSVVTQQKVAEVAELCLLEEYGEDASSQNSIQKSMDHPTPTPDSIPIRAPVPVSVQNHEDSIPRDRNWFPFLYPGIVSAIVAIATVIGVLWYSAPQSVKSLEEPVMGAQSETWIPVDELSQSGVHPPYQPESVSGFTAAGVTLNPVDVDGGANIQDQTVGLDAEASDEAVQTLLAQAGQLEQNNHLTLPKNNNAIATYQQVLDIQPDNIEAIQGIERIQQQFIQRARRAMDQSHWKTAQSYLIKAKQIAADDHAIDALMADVRVQQALQAQAIKISLSQVIDQQEIAAKKRANARYQLNEKGIDFDLTNFFLQAERGKTDMIALFLDANIPVDAHDNSLGDTALMKAASYGHLGTVKLMLKRQADVNKQNRIGRTALMSAIVFEQYDVALNLLKQTVDINIRDQNGTNALMFAVQKNQPAVVEAILKKGGDIHARNVLGQSALSIALEKDNHEIISLLQSTLNMR